MSWGSEDLEGDELQDGFGGGQSLQLTVVAEALEASQGSGAKDEDEGDEFEEDDFDDDFDDDFEEEAEDEYEVDNEEFPASDFDDGTADFSDEDDEKEEEAEPIELEEDE